MKVVFANSPIPGAKGTPTILQNRQFQWFSNPCFIYPVVPAQAATMLKNKGFEVAWLDGIAEKKSFREWLEEVKQEKADLLFLETKTPVVKAHWKIISNLKKDCPDLKIVLAGDHVTAFPKESFEKSKVDYILTGGDYDFLLLNLAEHLTKGKKLESGIWQRGKSGKPFSSGKFKQDHDLNKIPFIDRDLTKWKLYAYENGNYKNTPGTYIMSGRDCWWRKKGGCKFCAWTVLYPKFQTRSVENVLDEIGELIEKYKFREIMDDTGTFPAGVWLTDFCKGMIKRGYNKKINFDCNLRFGILKQEDYELMARAGFR
ncbi:B12-binding domain-containing radical SAM protein, partial [Candidatus Shapirobacteria bacterium CG10_big_fil_rev_8_21_14_0_10_38_14]